MNFAVLLRNARPREITQQQAAAAIGVSDSAISMWERGKRWPPVNDLAALLALYETQDHVRLALLNAAARPTPTSTEPA